MNEYINALEDGKSIDEVETYVPFVVEAIISAVNVSTYTKHTCLFILAFVQA